MFTEPDTWTDGSFELVLELGPRDDQRLRDAVTALWGHADLSGCYLGKSREPASQPRCRSDQQPLRSHLYGVATTPLGGDVACVSYPIRFDDGIDWLYLDVPLGSLKTAYPIRAYPIGRQPSHDWVLPVSEWFRGIGEQVFAAVSFRLGLVGWEADSPEVDSMLIERDGMPERRDIGYLWPGKGGLVWFPPNDISPSFEIE